MRFDRSDHPTARCPNCGTVVTTMSSGRGKRAFSKHRNPGTGKICAGSRTRVALPPGTAR